MPYRAAVFFHARDIQKRKDRVRKDGVGHGDIDMATASGRF